MIRLTPPNQPNNNNNICSPLARMGQEHFSIALLYRSMYGPSNFRNKISTILNSKIGLLTRPILSSKHVGAITSLDIDNNNCHGRYMLSSSWDGTISLLDLEQQPAAGSKTSSSNNSVVTPLHKSLRCRNPTTTTSTLPTGHSAAVTAVQWYTFDNGMFVSSSMDGSVLLWDTNSFQTAYIFRPFRSESSTATTNANHVTCMTLPRSTSSLHSLIATGSSSSSSILLCDVNSGAAVHTLQGHGRSVRCVTWSPANNSSFELCSGSADGTVRLWDIRKTGSHSCVCTLDYHSYFEPKKTTNQPPPPPNAYAHLQSCRLSSHEDPSTCITNVAYSIHGQYLATVGTDRKLHIWKNSSSANETTTGRTSSSSRIRLPLHFLGEQFLEGPANHIGPTPLVWTISNNDSYIWIGSRDNGNILRYKLVEDEGGGRPQWVLKGNLTSVQSLALRNVGGQEECTQIWSGSADGMILGWGRSNTTAATNTQVGRNNNRNRYYFPNGTTTTRNLSFTISSSSPAALLHPQKQEECDEDCWSE